MSDVTQADRDKLAREIAISVHRDKANGMRPTLADHNHIADRIEAGYYSDDLAVQAARLGILEGMKLQRERDAVIAENYPSPMNDLPMALAMRSVAAAIRSAL